MARPFRDFRVERRKLPPDAFAIGPDQEPKPTDIIEPDAWSSIIDLPDDVSLRTTDHHGKVIKRADDVWGYWTGLVLDLQQILDEPKDDALSLGCLSATDEFQASIYAAVTGYYRQSIATLRPALEGILTGTYFRYFDNPKRFQEWGDGFDRGHVWVNDMRSKLAKREPFITLEKKPPGLFINDTAWVPSLYKQLNAFSHSRPYLVYKGRKIPTTNVGLWGGSNGPVYEPRSFRLWSAFYFDVVLLSVLLIGFSEPRILDIKRSTDLPYFKFVDRILSFQPTSNPMAKHLITYLRSGRVSW